jgi:hypothetical protein
LERAEPESVAESFARVWERFERDRVLLRADARLPSLTSVVAGRPIAGSWWSHPLAHHIYDVCQELQRHPDVILVKLVGRKVTYLHRSLWSALLAVGASAAPWQTDGLSAAARSLAHLVEERGALRMDELCREQPAWRATARPAARELQDRLLTYSEDVHTDRGAHTRRLVSWRHWAARAGGLPIVDAVTGRTGLERAVRDYADEAWRDGLLPWTAADAPRRTKAPAGKRR